MDATTAATLVELAEEPGLWLPPEPSQTIVRGERYALVLRPQGAFVHRIRLEPGEVAGAVAVVRAAVRGRGIGEALWWVGEFSTPPGLAEELAGLGLEPGDPPALRTLGITRRPDGHAEVEVRRVETLEEYLQALAIDWEAFRVPATDLPARREAAVTAWPGILADGSSLTYLAFLDGEAAGFARAIFTPRAAILMGGATLPHARGRGVYTATVLARWEDAVARGVPRIAVSAGPLSAPVLERLGFEVLAGVRLLRDRL